MITADTGLLLSQWRDAAALKAITDIWLQIAQDEIQTPMDRLATEQNLDTASGWWLDRLGERLGVVRPSAPTSDADEFGFDAAGKPFDGFPLSDAERPVTAPIGDPLYRRILRARIVALHSDGTRGALEQSLRQIDPFASVFDRALEPQEAIFSDAITSAWINSRYRLAQDEAVPTALFSGTHTNPEFARVQWAPGAAIDTDFDENFVAYFKSDQVGGSPPGPNLTQPGNLALTLSYGGRTERFRFDAADESDPHRLISTAAQKTWLRTFGAPEAGEDWTVTMELVHPGLLAARAVTGRAAEAEIAKRVEALAVPAGVSLEIVSRDRFGFDAAGKPFGEGGFA